MMWKVTITTIDLYAMSALRHRYKPRVKVRIFDSKWRADWCAFWTAVPVPLLGWPFAKLVKVEPYWPSTNVVAFRRAS